LGKHLPPLKLHWSSWNNYDIHIRRVKEKSKGSDKVKFVTKKHIWPALALVLIGLALSSACAKNRGEAFSFNPAKPRPGQPVTVSYRPAGTPLEKTAGVELVAYFYIKGTPRVRSWPMTKKGSQWQATLTPGAKDRGAVIKFQAGETVDSNKRKGYILPLYDSRGNLVPGHKAGLAEAIAGWGNILAGLGINKIQALPLFEEDFAAHPEIKSDYLATYFTLLARIRQEKGQQQILKELAELAAKPNLTAPELTLLVNAYHQLEMPALAERFIRPLKEKEPKGEYVQVERFQSFIHEPDLKKKLALAEAFQKDFPDSKILGQLYYYVIIAFLKERRYREAMQFLDTHSSNSAWALDNALAWGLVRQGADLTMAEASAQKAVARARQNKDSDSIPKPDYLTDKEWALQKASALGQALDTLGFIQLRLKQTGPALATLKEAKGLLMEQNPAVNEHYAEALSQGAPPETTLAELERMISNRRGTARMKELLKGAYVAINGGEKGYAEFLARVESGARNKLKAELEARLLDEPAPDFSLADLKGNTVSLASLKGKVVVIDFWATWCEPCLDSFPGMKQAVTNFRNDPQVRFLFVNSWERVEDRNKNAVDFLAANDYPFQVLVDSQDQVIADYQVEAIPTQFIIDRRGRIRFRNEGFQGDRAEQVEELVMMIGLIR
jgi:peroxiredoxin/transcriptional regulator with XRE-family HTH domain